MGKDYIKKKKIYIYIYIYIYRKNKYKGKVRETNFTPRQLGCCALDDRDGDGGVKDSQSRVLRAKAGGTQGVPL